MRTSRRMRRVVYAVGLLVLTAPAPVLARSIVFTSPAMRSPVDGALQCTVFNGSATKSIQGIQIEFRRVDNDTAGASDNCGSNLAPKTGCMATLAGFCETEACACVFTMQRGDRRTVRGALMAIDSGGTVTGAVELRR